MFWLFALGIISLCVFHEGFRKLMLVLMGGSVVIILCIFMYSSQEAHERQAQSAAETARLEAERAKWPKCDPIDEAFPDDPDISNAALASLDALAKQCRL